MKRVLLYQGLSPTAAELLRAAGWNAIHVSEEGLDRSPDRAILEFATRTGRCCITLDHDFHAHLALQRASGPSVVFVRVEGLGASQQAKLIEDVWSACERQLEQGAAVSTDGSRIRLRRLPLK
jgi:predicted nuclease of predicted toxin-antitoxin system